MSNNKFYEAVEKVSAKAIRALTNGSTELEKVYAITELENLRFMAKQEKPFDIMNECAKHFNKEGK